MEPRNGVIVRASRRTTQKLLPSAQVWARAHTHARAFKRALATRGIHAYFRKESVIEPT